MLQTTCGPSLSETLPAVTAVTATPATTTTRTATPHTHPDTAARSGGTRMAILPNTPVPTHLCRLQYIQKVCENQTGQPCFLSVADAALALRGLERYFAPLFEPYELSLSEVRETLLWAEEEHGGTLLVEDVIQTLVARIWEEQYLRRRLARGREAR